MKYQGISIIKNKTCNTWYARFRKDGKQFYISAKTQQLCYDKLKEALKQKSKEELKAVKQNSNKIKTKKTITLQQWYEKWLTLYKSNVKPLTIEDYEKSLKYLKTIIKKPLNTITTIEFIEILNNIPYERRKQNVYDLANALFEKALINDIIDKNPIKVIEKPKHKKVNGIAFSNEDEIILIKTLQERNLDIYLVCLYQGLRRGEVLALTTDDIDLENNLLTINKAINGYDKLDTTKNTYSNRIMPLFNNTKEILKKYKNKNGRIFNETYKNIEYAYYQIVKEKFPTKNYTLHSLRHTFITKCQEKQIPLHIIQKWVGHNIGSNVTTQVYTHTRELAEAENIIKMNT